MDVPHEKQFHFRDGHAVHDLESLRDSLESISYQEFYHHVNAEKNDFASWVQHVLEEPQLGADLEKVTSIVETVEILNDHLHPLPVEQPHDDMQSKIEEEALGIHMPADIPEEPIEEVPTTTPDDTPPIEQPEEPEAPVDTQEEADLNVIGQSLEESAEEPSLTETVAPVDAQEEPEPEPEESAPEEPEPEKPAPFEEPAPVQAPETPVQEAVLPLTADDHVLSKHDYTRLIVKDFMYGLIFGLIIGLILGKIIPGP